MTTELAETRRGLFEAEVDQFGDTDQAESHAKAEEATHVGHEARVGHLLVPDDPGGEAVFDVDVEPHQIVFGILVENVHGLDAPGVGQELHFHLRAGLVERVVEDVEVVAERRVFAEQNVFLDLELVAVLAVSADGVLVDPPVADLHELVDHVADFIPLAKRGTVRVGS